MAKASPTRQFVTAKAFADFLCKERWGRKHVLWLNQTSWKTRLEHLMNDCESQAKWGIEDGGLEFGYNAASYGLWWVLTTGRLDGETAKALQEMKARQLCELVHVLLVECGPTAEKYASFLMQRLGGK